MCGFGDCAETYKGENLAGAGNATASAAFLQWKNSPARIDHTLDANYTIVGIGRAAGGHYRWYWTADFGGK